MRKRVGEKNIFKPDRATGLECKRKKREGEKHIIQRHGRHGNDNNWKTKFSETTSWGHHHRQVETCYESK